MARGKKFKNKKYNHSKFRNEKKKPKTRKKRTLNEIKHVDLFKKYKTQVRAQRRQKPETESEEETEQQIELDPVDQLLSTFDGKGNSAASNAAVDSEESSEEDMEEDDDLNEEGDDPENQEEGVEEAEPAAEEIESDDEPLDIKNEEEVINSDDPFNIHLNYDLDDSLLESLTVSPPKTETTTVYWPTLHNLKIEIPISKRQSENKSDKPYIGEKKESAKQGKPPKLITDIDWDNLYVKAQIQNQIAKANSKQLGDSNELLTPLQKELFSVMNNYQDLFYPERDYKNGEEVRFSYCLHAVNHILKTRTKILHHNEKLSKKIKEEVPDEYRDQGLVRPKVLILAPFRDSCLRIVNMISDIVIADEKGMVLNKSKFTEEYSGSELAMPKRRPKPEDYEELFKGNVDDTFRIGISITKKSIKLYTEFYSSDIIIASPLGLRLIIGAEGDKVRDFDFLSSIELLILDQTEVFLMQNWDHLLLVFDNIHMQPKQNHNTDITRIRSWAINGWTKFYRQTLIFSSITTPELNSLFNKRCQNYAGKVRVANPVDDGSIRHIVVPLAQVFQKFKANSPAEAIEERFKVLVEKILPQYRDPLMTGVLIYVPSYFDFVRIRNHLKNETFTFVQVCEYSKDAKVARARDMFYHNQARFLLYSERFHFFRRVRLKGIRHIIFYQPPTFPHFYSEMCNLMHENFQNKFVPNDGNTTVTVMYCKYDIHRLAAIVKTSRSSKMVSSDKDVHMFTTG